MFIATASGKGGTGKTLVSTALALSAGKCTYVDLDVEEPNGFIFLDPKIEKEIPYSLPVPVFDENVCAFCEACSKACTYNALAVIPPLKKVMFFTELCHSCGVCTYVCPVESAITETDKEIGKIRFGNANAVTCIEGRLNVGRPSGVPLISGIIEHYLDKEDLLIIDAPPGTSCPVVESIKDSDYVILVTEPTPFGLNDLKLAAEIVKSIGKDAGIIINKDTGKKAGIEEFSKEAQIPILSRIPYSVEIQEAYSRGIPLTESMPEIKQEFSALLNTITGKK
jgi:MinD superfamily P-loop ATPase